MLTGPELGAALAAAIKKKGITKAALARHFEVTPPSVQDWIKRGVIDKRHLEGLWDYFSDVVGPEHWGLSSTPNRRRISRRVASDRPAWPFPRISEKEVAALPKGKIKVIEDGIIATARELGVDFRKPRAA